MAKKVKIRVISGGQVGADKIGLEEARKLGFQTGGTAPLRFHTSKGSDVTLKVEKEDGDLVLNRMY